ncbi:unnamed protein product [Periconia digitata]|uniref:Uncharacterized protein n=1 Tax=Periconia digitata TaxID=1303443 RepID=A0A9W4UA84_9PLEO|nr:unnamed protein product [Periconia digitata]
MRMRVCTKRSDWDTNDMEAESANPISPERDQNHVQPTLPVVQAADAIMDDFSLAAAPPEVPESYEVPPTSGFPSPGPSIPVLSGNPSSTDCELDSQLNNIINDPFGIGRLAQRGPDSAIPSIEDTRSLRSRRPCLGFHDQDSSEEPDDREEFATPSTHSDVEQPLMPNGREYTMHDSGLDDLIEPMPLTVNNEHDDGTSLFVTDDQHFPRAPQKSPPTQLQLPYQESVSISSHPVITETPQPVPSVSMSANTTPPITISKLGQLKARRKKIQARNMVPGHQPTSHSNLFNQPHVNTVISEMDEYDTYNKRAENDFQQRKRHYDRIRGKNGKLSFTEEVQWMKIAQDEEARKRKLLKDAKMAERESDDVNLFPDFMEQDESRTQGNHSEDNLPDIETSDTPKRKRPELPRKQAKEFSLQEAELQSMYVGLEGQREKPAKKKPRTSDGVGETSNGSGGPPKVAKPRSKRPKGTTKSATGTSKPRQTNKQKKENEHATKQVASLFTTNVFRQQAPEDAPAEPTFNASNKQEAFKQMLSSLTVGEKKDAKSDIHGLRNAIMEFTGRGSVKPAEGGMWLVKGMKTPLKAYQITGTAFMRRRENALEEPRGGLLADQMGLGKTLMMLANIVNGSPDSEAEHKTTLIVAGAGLLSQWADEIGLHTNCGLRVMKYTTGSRIDSNLIMQILGGHDIILTSYTEIMHSYPKNEPPIECQTTEEKNEWWKNTFETRRGALHRMMFHRVVLDEAQAIKNCNSRTSIACRALIAHHKWALSGTPIVNNLTELYPYFRFLNVPNTGSLRIFKHNYCDPGNTENNERLLVRLAQFMLRRTHEDEFGGAPILKLPKAGQMTQWCDFNPVERSIYTVVQTRFATIINNWSQNKQLDKAYSNVLVMLLRLRQLTSSPLMLQFVLRDLAEREDIEKIRIIVNEAAYNRDTREGQLILALRKQLAGWKEDAQESSLQNLDRDSVSSEQGRHDGYNSTSTASASAKTGKAFGKEFNFTPYLNSLASGDNWDRLKQASKCSMCDKPLKQNSPTWITSCSHLSCQKCYEQTALREAISGPQSCKSCGEMIENFTPVSAEEAAIYNGGPAERTRSRKDKERKKIEEQDIKDDWLMLGGESVLPSAKTIAVKAQILNWIKENPDVKIIIYTQFLAMIKILSKMCQEEGWVTEQYHGKLNFNARNNAIKSFANNPQAKVLLASLRCGGLGLNLTMASKVMILDPWWNSAAEQQAFCRVYRFGQREQTFLTRLCVKNTVDERLIAMQERKQREIDAIMEDKGKTTSSMSIRDLMRLFGNLDEDEAGNPFIVVDNPDPRGGFRADDDHEGYVNDD